MARIAKVKKTPKSARAVYPWCFRNVKSLATGMPFCYRYRLADPFLEASIKKYGILMPIVVSDAARPVVIAGHKRFHVARTLKMKEIPVFVAERVKPKDAFLLNLVSNWKGTPSDMDRVKALGMAARNFSFHESDLLSEVMPLLGLPEDKATLELLLKFDRFPLSLKDLIEDGQLSLRGAVFLLKFPRDDQEYFAEKIGSLVRLTSSQLLQAGEWLSDMMRGKGESLEVFCRKHKVLEGLHVPGMDPRAKADKFFARLKWLRSPHYSSFLEHFEEKAAPILRDAKGIRLEPVQGFEEPGFELHARVKTPEELDRFLQRMTEKRAALNSLFEIML